MYLAYAGALYYGCQYGRASTTELFLVSFCLPTDDRRFGLSNQFSCVRSGHKMCTINEGVRGVALSLRSGELVLMVAGLRRLLLCLQGGIATPYLAGIGFITLSCRLFFSLWGFFLFCWGHP